MRNCPNCSAPIEPYVCRCSYCGTYYFDFTAIDMTEDTPYYVKFKTPFGIVTALTKPYLDTIQNTSEETEIRDGRGNVAKRLVTSAGCDLNVRFTCLSTPESKSLLQIQIEE